ncbi:MAG: 7-cyano-7-deazaguanine synthase QueC [Deltaproteobacteria bacterium]|jgi:7-cyano-7-deazaguanine synthase|nr:7-cyano-7-deazaguanine synthase QueC [Deltaproteobacteria bacterium]
MNNSSQAKIALVVFSGGQDSTTCLYWALKHFEDVRTLTFDYGQRHRIELECAKKIAQLAKVHNEVLSIDTFTELGGNALTGSEVVETHQENIIDEDLPNTFVPGRNLILLSFAAARAWQLGIENIVTGVCQTDYSGYPDCRKNTIEALQLALNLGMERQFVLHTPLMLLTKAQTVRMAKDLGALEALSFSHTCYNGTFPPCGTCPACHLRQKGFSEAGVIDPLIKRTEEVT